MIKRKMLIGAVAVFGLFVFVACNNPDTEQPGYERPIDRSQPESPATPPQRNPDGTLG